MWEYSPSWLFALRRETRYEARNSSGRGPSKRDDANINLPVEALRTCRSAVAALNIISWSLACGDWGGRDGRSFVSPAWFQD